ncbi:MAG: sulfatase-like hydrolase/transferase [Candidatus Omnitrophica bacterium]|nr:sulfatase-like hydrolase/transferase [Candidatus Omnitrophota bacterium]
MLSRKPLTRRHFLQSSLTAALALGLPKTSGAGTKPNFVLIVADDLGYGDIGCYGNRINRTPNLDLMSQEGLRFTDFHANGPVCSPTRAALLTGRYQQRMGIEEPIGNQGAGLGELDEITIASYLRKAGYTTGIFGKWHLGTQPSDNPIHHGFSEFRGHLYSAQDYQSHINRWGMMDWRHNDKVEFEQGYNTHLITRRAVQFIKDHKDKPFFLYVPHSAIHFPWMSPDDPPYRKEGGNYDSLLKLGPHEDVTDVVKKMVEELDKSVGEIMGALKAHGLDEKTFVFFTSDNGGYRHYAGLHRGEISDNGPLRGQKTDVFEGGHRVPAIARWPGRIKTGEVTHEMALTMDLTPTYLELAGIEPPLSDDAHALDGASISSVLFEGKAMAERTVFFRKSGDRAVRRGPWKMVWLKNHSPMLFHLDNDIGEQNNLAEQHSALMEKLKTALFKWEQDVDAR